MKWIEDILFEIDSQGLIDIDLATQKLSEYIESNYVSTQAHSQKITEFSAFTFLKGGRSYSSPFSPDRGLCFMASSMLRLLTWV